MESAKVACLTLLAEFLALAGASGWLVYRRAPWPFAAVIGGIAGGIILLILLSWLLAIPKNIVEWWRIVRARAGREPRNGKREAIIGTLHGHGELISPFKKERCVLYLYEIVTRDVHDGESSWRKMYEGFAMVPLSIGDGGERTRLLARPDVKPFPANRPKSRAAEENAKQFIEHTTFTPAPARAVEEKDLSHTDGRLRFDYSRAPLETNIGACDLMEKTLRADTTVCALGTYSADRRALLAPVTLRTGTTFATDAAWRVVRSAIGTAVVAAITIVVFGVFCANFPLDAVEQSHPEWNIAWWEVDLERFVDRTIRTPLGKRDLLSASGFRLQEICDGCAKGRLEIDGRTIELKHATYTGGRTVHLSAKPGDRDGVTLDGRDRVILTLDGKAAEVPASWMQPNDIRTALGSHGDYAGRITFIAPDGWMRCRVSFNTKVDADAWLPGRATP